MADTETPPTPAAVEKKPESSTLEADLTKYKVNLSNLKHFILQLASQVASDIVHNVTQQMIKKIVEGAKLIDLCIEGDKLIEEGTGAVYNKAVKGVKVTKGVPLCWFIFSYHA